MSSDKDQKGQGSEFRFDQSTDFDLDLDGDGVSADDLDMLGTHSGGEAAISAAAAKAGHGETSSSSAKADTVAFGGGRAEEDPGKKKPQNKANLMIIVVVLVMLAMLGGLGYVAWGMFLNPKASAHQQRADLGAPQIEATSATAIAGDSTALDTANGIASAIGDLDQTAPAPGKPDPLVIEDALGGPTDESVVGGASTEHSLAMPVTGSDQGGTLPAAPDQHEQTAAPATEEDQIYDHLLSQASKLDAPSGAIKIDSGVVNQTLERKRLEKLEGDVSSARSDVTEMKLAVKVMQSQVSEISSAVSASQANNEKLIGAIDALSKDVAASNKMHEEELAALNKKIDGASLQAKKAAESAAVQAAVVPSKAAAPVSQPRPAAPAPQVVQRPLPAPAPVPASKPVEVVRSAPVTIPTPMEVRSVTAPNVPAQPEMPAHCDGRFVSSNWRVKGINDSSAYVVRVQDGAGLLVRSGMTIPGFGDVQSFDRVNRSICTTQGLVKR